MIALWPSWSSASIRRSHLRRAVLLLVLLGDAKVLLGDAVMLAAVKTRIERKLVDFAEGYLRGWICTLLDSCHQLLRILGAVGRCGSGQSIKTTRNC